MILAETSNSKTQNSSLLIDTLAPDNYNQSINVMTRPGENGSYTGEFMLCERLVQARDKHISQTNIETVYYYFMRAPEPMGQT